MKKVIIFFCFIAILQTSVAQNIDIDSLKTLLGQTTSLNEKYTLLKQIKAGYYIKGIGENNAEGNLELLRIALQLKQDSLLAESYNFVGDYYLFEKGDVNTGLEYLFKAIPYAQKNKNGQLSSIYIDISFAYFFLENYPELLKFAKKAEDALPDKSPWLLFQVKMTFASYFLSVRKPTEALTYLNAVQEINNTLKSPNIEIQVNSLFGDYYNQSGDNDLASIYFKRASALDSSINYPLLRVAFKIRYINYLASLKDYSQAISEANELSKISEQTQNNSFRFISAGLLKTIYEKQNKFDSAYYFAKKESALKDTLFNQEKINKIQALNFNEESRVMKIEEERKQNIQYALISLGIILLLTLYLLMSRSFITNTKIIEFFGVVALLIVFEFLNLLLHPFLERITHHSPFLMLLGLVCIAALLVPLHHKLEHWATTKLIEKNKQIRLANAKKAIQKLETNEEENLG